MDIAINDSTSAFYMCSVFLLFFTTIYMGIRIYIKNKYFSNDWIAKKGQSLYQKDEDDWGGESSEEEEDQVHQSNKGDSPVKQSDISMVSSE